MSILNRASDGLPSVLLALRGTLATYGPLEEDRLLALCAPPSVVPDGKPDMARRTLLRWKQLGLFIESQGKVQLHEDIARIPLSDLTSFRSAMLRLVVSSDNNPLLMTDQDQDMAEDKSPATDFVRAACWFLAQDPYSFPASYREIERLQSQQRANPKPFVNDTRWQGFSEWACFLGIAWTARSGLIADPSFAIQVNLNTLFGDDITLGQQAFVLELARVLPILDGGAYRLRIETETEQLWRRANPHELSPSFSLALLHLEEADQIRLELRADAPERIWLVGRRGQVLRQISHLTRVGRRADV